MGNKNSFLKWLKSSKNKEKLINILENSNKSTNILLYYSYFSIFYIVEVVKKLTRAGLEPQGGGTNSENGRGGYI